VKRFLIFLVLFPVVATVTVYAVLYILTGAVVDSVSGPATTLLAMILPGLLAGLLDWLVARSSLPAVVATTVLTYGLSVLVMTLLLGSSTANLALGLIGAIPAAICSWLSGRSDGAAQAPSPAI
jgi:hypothetical protein